MDGARSPLLDINMIESNMDLFQSIDGFYDSYREAMNKPYHGCMSCRNAYIKEFVQHVRDQIVVNWMTNITSKLDPRTIIRHGRRIYRASEII